LRANGRPTAIRAHGEPIVAITLQCCRWRTREPRAFSATAVLSCRAKQCGHGRTLCYGRYRGKPPWVVYVLNEAWRILSQGDGQQTLPAAIVHRYGSTAVGATDAVARHGWRRAVRQQGSPGPRLIGGLMRMPDCAPTFAVLGRIR